MATTDTAEQQPQQHRSFDDSDSRADEMRDTLEAWVEDLADLTDEARATEQFQEWLDVQSKFHDYSHRNTLLIRMQCPHATKVAGFWTWQNEFNRSVKKGESAIWIWAPIITNKCPECGNSSSYHEQADCDYDETEPDAWDEGLVGFKPTSVFDVSQTEGEPLPELDTEAYGDGDALVGALLSAGNRLGYQVDIVSPDDWDHGSAKGVCKHRDPFSMTPIIEVLDRASAAVASTLVHEFAHAQLHHGVEDTTERSKREVEAEAVAYVVGRYFGLDTSNSSFYLAAWEEEATDALHERLFRISTTAEDLIDTIDRAHAQTDD
jgi:hypothetical protein